MCCHCCSLFCLSLFIEEPGCSKTGVVPSLSCRVFVLVVAFGEGGAAVPTGAGEREMGEGFGGSGSPRFRPLLGAVSVVNMKTNMSIGGFSSVTAWQSVRGGEETWRWVDRMRQRRCSCPLQGFICARGSIRVQASPFAGTPGFAPVLLRVPHRGVTPLKGPVLPQNPRGRDDTGKAQPLGRWL